MKHPISTEPKKSRVVLGGSSRAVRSNPAKVYFADPSKLDLSFPRDSIAYKKLSRDLYQLIADKRSGAAVSDSEAAAAAPLREAHPVGNTGITSNVAQS